MIRAESSEAAFSVRQSLQIEVLKSQNPSLDLGPVSSQNTQGSQVFPGRRFKPWKTPGKTGVGKIGFSWGFPT